MSTTCSQKPWRLETARKAAGSAGSLRCTLRAGTTKLPAACGRRRPARAGSPPRPPPAEGVSACTHLPSPHSSHRGKPFPFPFSPSGFKVRFTSRYPDNVRLSHSCWALRLAPGRVAGIHTGCKVATSLRTGALRSVPLHVQKGVSYVDAHKQMNKDFVSFIFAFPCSQIPRILHAASLYQ